MNTIQGFADISVSVNAYGNVVITQESIEYGKDVSIVVPAKHARLLIAAIREEVANVRED